MSYFIKIKFTITLFWCWSKFYVILCSTTLHYVIHYNITYTFLQLPCNFVHPIFLVNNNVARHNCIGVVEDNFREAHAMSHLNIHTVIPRGWALQVNIICLKKVLLARANCTQKHRSVAMSTLCVVMGFWWVRNKIKSTAKSLEFDVLSNTPLVQSHVGYSTDSTFSISAWHVGQVAGELCTMVVFFHCLVLKGLLIRAPPSLQSQVGYYIHKVHLGAGTFSAIPVSCELLRNLRKFLLTSLSDHGGITRLQTCKRWEERGNCVAAAIILIPWWSTQW